MESVKLGWSELIAGDYLKYDRELEILEALDNDEIKRVAKKYLAGKHINSNEFLAGDRNLLTPIFSFIWNGILMRSSSMRISMKKSNIDASED